MKKKKMKMKKMENGRQKKKRKKKRKKKEKNNQIFGSIIQSSPASRQSCYTPQFMQTSSSYLVSPIFFLVVISSLALSPASLAEKPSFPLRISPRISFPLVPTCCEILYIPLVYGLPNWEVWCVPMLILFVDVGFVIVDGVFVVVVSIVSIVIVTSWLLATGLDWDGGWNGR